MFFEPTMPSPDSPIHLLILVFSRPTERGAEQRAALRNAWAHDRRACGFFTVRFVLGGGNSSGAATAHNDTVVLDIGEGYSSLSLKVLAGFAWALGSAAPSFSHLLKTDDDSFVCVGGVLRWLERLPRRRRDSLYAGSPLAQRCAGKEHLPVLRQLALPRLLRDRKCRRGWRFPLTMHGAGYLLSRGTAVQVVRRAEALHPVPNAEDLTVALLLHYRSRQTNGSGADAASATASAAASAAGKSASRTDPHLLNRPRPSPEQQTKLLAQRCRQVVACGRHKRRANASCDDFRPMQSRRGADADREVADGTERGARCGLELPRSGSFSGSVRREWGLQWALAEIYAQERLVFQQE
ncbi:hypothetical protein EMIHUDRAFT_104937 [Emiliania huxleyi CCMP1516]|uniref:Hexosyltransferase n=2 Tax=Emiliania huxleyi TaxID=2903 RepID=A0A0D3IHV2_EMIH1|nr:hypothetical protein EMIHUDRAFT_104937 [Emiliania huxleyi CCMP1516]EOD10837.1 hypothetical protein EMIHUDRAFT_104937 [Emiliania huxleyi CCMP1516]|eukprot:XP_005763266.1 hypothetical protein EMIHUDRAFT_104937 [Emiliania huxleyi CCMP1516]